MNFPSDAAVAGASATTTASRPSCYDTTTGVDNTFSYYSTTTEVPLGSTHGANPFAIPSGWSYPMPQPQGTTPGDNSMAQESDINISPLDGIGWVPTPGSVDWNNWTHQ